jgi:hypothetical protein
MLMATVYLESNGMQHVNETKYEEVGLAYSGAQYTWQMFMASPLSNHSPDSSPDVRSGWPRTCPLMSGALYSWAQKCTGYGKPASNRGRIIRID